MKLFVLLLIGIIQFSEEKPTTLETTTTGSTTENESSTVSEPSSTLKPEDAVKTVLPIEKEVKNSSEVEDPPKDVQLPVDLTSDDILLDPSVILARIERDVASLDGNYLPQPEIPESFDVDQFNDGIPTYYFLKFVRVPRSVDPRLVPEKNEHFRMPEEFDKTLRRISRSAKDDEARDLDGADDGFIIRPLFKYRHEQLKRSKNRRYRNRDTYSYYPRYPIFPGK